MKKGIAVLFPGIGYTNDRSLLYFSGKLAENEGCKLLRISYSGFPSGVKGDRKKMQKSFQIAKKQAEKQLEDISWEKYEDIVFISKSIGTVVSSTIAKEKGLSVRSIVFTPLAETFVNLEGRAIVFHGTADPRAETEEIAAACREKELPLFITEEANHSLETGDVMNDVRNLAEILEQVRSFL